MENPGSTVRPSRTPRGRVPMRPPATTARPHVLVTPTTGSCPFLCSGRVRSGRPPRPRWDRSGRLRPGLSRPGLSRPHGAVVAQLLLRGAERVAGVLARTEQEAVRAVPDRPPGLAPQAVEPTFPFAEDGGDDERDRRDRRACGEHPDRDLQAGEPGNHE